MNFGNAMERNIEQILRLSHFSIFGRLIPAFILLVPFVLLVFSFEPTYKISNVMAILLLICVLYLFEQWCADRGKKIEKKLVGEWDGTPAVRFLRHANQEYNKNTHKRVHEKLTELGFNIPSEEEERKNVKKADESYQSCIDEIFRRTCNNDNKFPIVQKEFTAYHFKAEFTWCTLCRNRIYLNSFYIIFLHKLLSHND